MTNSPIGRRVEAWIGPRENQKGTIVRVNGIRMSVIRWDNGDVDEYPNADLIRASTIGR